MCVWWEVETCNIVTSFIQLPLCAKYTHKKSNFHRKQIFLVCSIYIYSISFWLVVISTMVSMEFRKSGAYVCRCGAAFYHAVVLLVIDIEKRYQNKAEHKSDSISYGFRPSIFTMCYLIFFSSSFPSSFHFSFKLNDPPHSHFPSNV